jgi:2-keto-4-pentenoate hydratase
MRSGLTESVAALAAAHRGGAVPVAIDAPADVAEAYAAQEALAGALGQAPGGWKIALHPVLGPIAAPMYARDILAAPARWPFRPGLAIEIEVAVRLARDLPAPPRDRADLLAAVSEVLIGVEFFRRRVAADASPLALMADNLGNDGYAFAPAVPAWLGLDPASRRLTVTFDGAVVHDAPCAHAFPDVLAPMLGMADGPALPFGGFRAGQIVTTGTLVRPIPLAGPGHMSASVEGLGTIAVEFG